jgi:hypothetical protein
VRVLNHHLMQRRHQRQIALIDLDKQTNKQAKSTSVG